MVARYVYKLVKEGGVKAGQVIWMQAGSNVSENFGKTDPHALLIEFK